MTSDAASSKRGKPNAAEMPWTLWRAAYAFAHVIREVGEPPVGSASHERSVWDVPTMLLAYAIADGAAEGGITVTSPADLVDLSMTALLNRLHPALLAESLSLRPATHAVFPAEGEPAFEAIMMMKAEIDDFNAGGATAVLADPYRRAKASRNEPGWYDRDADARKLIERTLLALVDPVDLGRDVTLALVANRVPGAGNTSLPALLRAAVPVAPKARRWRWPGSRVPGGAGSVEADEELVRARERVAVLAAPPDRFGGSGDARDLLALLLYTAAHERDQAVTEVPWSAARARLLLDTAELVDYLTDVLTALGHHVGGRMGPEAFQRMARHHGKGKRTPLKDSVGLTLRRVLSGDGLQILTLPAAKLMLDAVLMTERRAFTLGSTITIERMFSDQPESATVTGAVWKLGRPPAARPGMIDLAPGTPTGYLVRVPGGSETRVPAEKCSAADTGPST